MRKYFFKKLSKRDLAIALIILTVGILGRILLKDIPNIETLTLACLLAGAFLGRPYIYILPLIMIAITDTVLGNSPILLFTWSAWLAIGIFSLILKKTKKESLSFPLFMTGSGIVASVFFFLWTNFGVWALFNMYPHTFSGLMTSYLMGLPFLKFQILGNLAIILPVSLFISLGLKALRQKHKTYQKELS